MNKIDRNKNNLQSFKGAYANILSDFATKSTILPTVALESTVLAGRSYHANKRGGEYELKESLIEEICAAAIWLGGVKTLNKLSDSFFKNIFKIDTSVDWGKIDSLTKGRIDPDKFKKTLIAAKSSKLIFSVMASIAAVGWMIPKIKQKYTKDKIDNEIRKPISENYEIQPFNDVLSKDNNTAFRSKKPATAVDNIIAQNNISHKENSDFLINFERDITPYKKAENYSGLSFKGTYDTIARIGHAMENNAVAQLSVVDTGITGGRVVTARNKDEGFEFAFRDISSWIFYLFSMPWIAKKLAKGLDGRLNIDTKIDSKTFEPLAKEIESMFKNSVYGKNQSQINPAIPIEVHFNNFKQELLGIKNEEFVNVVKRVINLQPDNKISVSEIESLALELKSTLLNELKNTTTEDFIVKYIQDLSARSKVFATHNTNVLFYDKFNILNNLIDDLQKGNQDLIQLAERSKGFNNFFYHKMQTCKPITDGDLKAVASMAKEVKAFLFDHNSTQKIDQLVHEMSSIQNAEGVILQKNIEKLVRGGIQNDSAALGKILAFINKSYTNPTKDLSPDLIKELSSNLESNLNLILKELEKSIKTPNNVLTDESLLGKFKAIANKFKNKTLTFKSLYLGAGFLVSAIFLAIVIPRTQQKLTKIRTGKNHFPGVSGLIDEQTSTRSKEEPNKNKMQINHSNLSSRASKTAISDEFDSFMQKSYVRTAT